MSWCSPFKFPPCHTFFLHWAAGNFGIQLKWKLNWPCTYLFRLSRIYLYIYWICSNFQAQLLLIILGKEWMACRNSWVPTLWFSRCQGTAVQGLSWSFQEEQLPWCPAIESCEQGRRKEDWNRQSQQLVCERYHKGLVRQSINKAIILFYCILWCLSAIYNLPFCDSSQPKWIFVFTPNIFLLIKFPLLKKIFKISKTQIFPASALSILFNLLYFDKPSEV